MSSSASDGEAEKPGLLAEVHGDVVAKLHDRFGTASSESEKGRCNRPTRTGGRRRRSETKTTARTARRDHQSEARYTSTSQLTSGNTAYNRHIESGIAVVLSGMSGVGKSSIAQIFGEQACSNGHYPLGVHHLNLRSSKLLSSSVNSLVNPTHCQRSYGATDVFSAHAWQQMVSVRKDQRALVILDNADLAADLEPDGRYSVMWSYLLPGRRRSPHVLIVTQCSVLPASLSSCVEAHLEVLPLSELQSTWMLACLTKRLCQHSSMPHEWKAFSASLHQQCKLCGHQQQVSKDRDSQRTLHSCHDVRLPELGRQAASAAADTHTYPWSARECSEVVLLARHSKPSNGLPISIALSAASVDSKLKAHDSTLDGNTAFDQPGSAATAQYGLPSGLYNQWLLHYTALSEAAKQLLSIIAFFQPDCIHLILLIHSQQTALYCMPSELSQCLFQDASGDEECGSSAEGDSLLVEHNMLVLLTELRQHSLLLPVLGGHRKSHASTAGSHLVVAMHRLLQRCTLFHLRSICGAFPAFLHCAVRVLLSNAGSSWNILFSMSHILPHALHLTSGNFFRETHTDLEVCLSGVGICRRPSQDLGPTSVYDDTGRLLEEWTSLLTYCFNTDSASREEWSHIMTNFPADVAWLSGSVDLAMFSADHEQITRCLGCAEKISSLLCMRNAELCKQVLNTFWPGLRADLFSSVHFEPDLCSETCNFCMHRPACPRRFQQEMTVFHNTVNTWQKCCRDIFDSIYISHGNLDVCRTILDVERVGRTLLESGFGLVEALNTIADKSLSLCLPLRQSKRVSSHQTPLPAHKLISQGAKPECSSEQGSVGCFEDEGVQRPSTIATLDPCQQQRPEARWYITWFLQLVEKGSCSAADLPDECWRPLMVLAVFSFVSQNLQEARVTFERARYFALTRTAAAKLNLIRRALLHCYALDPEYYWLQDEPCCV